MGARRSTSGSTSRVQGEEEEEEEEKKEKEEKEKSKNPNQRFGKNRKNATQLENKLIKASMIMYAT